jgi:CelD/BcsL family acetyltransferase involved in cellulose biosynthesis
VAIYRSLASLAGLRDEWDELAERLQSPTLEHDWFESCVRAFHDESDLRVAVLKHSGRLLAVAPLVIDRSRHSRLVLPGASALYEPGGWVYTSSEGLRAITSDVVSMREPIVLHRVQQPSDLIAAVPGHLFGSAIKLIRSVPPSLALDIEGTWDTYVGTLPSRTFRKMASIRRRAEREIGPVTVTMCEPRPGQVDGYLDLLATIESAGWKGRRGSALALRPDLRRFFVSYAHRAAQRRRLRVAVLSLGSRPAAIEVAVEASGRLWVLKIAYDEGLSTYGPGLLLTHASIQRAFDTGLRSYEFLGVAEAWQERWKPSRREYAAMALYPLSPRGAICAAADLYSAVSRRVVQSRAKSLTPALGRVA